MNILNEIKNRLIVSAQASFGEPLNEENAMNALIETIVKLGNINALRLAGARDIRNTKEKFPNVTIIGITKPKKIPDNYKEMVYITPTSRHALEIIEAGADIIAFDGTTRNQNADEIINTIHNAKKIAMADIATFEDAIYSKNLGADIISTTLSGYTKETETMPDTPDFSLLEKCVKKIKLPTILEGKIWSEKDVEHAFKLGAHSVVIGSAITRPQNIIQRFKRGLK